MQLLADYFPLILFFIAFKWQGIYVATAVAIAASIAQIAWLRWKRGRVAPVHWLSLAIIAVFGGATLILHDETFIKWKPTVLYGLFGTILAVGRLGFGRNLISYVMQGIDAAGRRLGRASPGRGWLSSRSWPCSTGTSRSTTRPTPGSTSRCGAASGLFLVFALAQGLFLARHLKEEAAMTAAAAIAERRCAPGSRRSRRRCSRSTTTAPSMPATPARPAAAGTFRC